MADKVFASRNEWCGMDITTNLLPLSQWLGSQALRFQNSKRLRWRFVENQAWETAAERKSAIGRCWRCFRPQIWIPRRHLYLNILLPECICQNRIPELRIFKRDHKSVLTPLTLPSRNARVALRVINVPSTTGTNVKVPKKPLLFSSTLVFSKTLELTRRRQLKVSSDEEQLQTRPYFQKVAGLRSGSNLLRERYRLAVKGLGGCKTPLLSQSFNRNQMITLPLGLHRHKRIVTARNQSS